MDIPGYTMKKQKKLVTFTDNQIKFIEEISKTKQISFSEALRRVLDDCIARKSNEDNGR